MEYSECDVDHCGKPRVELTEQERGMAQAIIGTLEQEPYSLGEYLSVDGVRKLVGYIRELEWLESHPNCW
jgi:hypothetical protein